MYYHVKFQELSLHLAALESHRLRNSHCRHVDVIYVRKLQSTKVAWPVVT
jgi:hypothetical protein